MSQNREPVFAPMGLVRLASIVIAALLLVFLAKPFVEWAYENYGWYGTLGIGAVCLSIAAIIDWRKLRQPEGPAE